MESEPSKAEPSKRKRRWFQFSLRILLIGVTLLAIPCAYVGWQAKIVRQRRAMLFNNPRVGVLSSVVTVDGEPDVSWLRRWLGDDHPGNIVTVDDASEAELDEYRSEFPEADNVLRKSDMQKLYGPSRTIVFGPNSDAAVSERGTHR
jgi:hypothetical protein